MPVAPPRACARCGAVDCQVHQRAAWHHSEPVKRITGTRLQRLRNQLFDRQPLCVLCQRVGRVTVATIRDHIVPLAFGGKDVEANVQPVCARCHDAKTADESKRGIGR